MSRYIGRRRPVHFIHLWQPGILLHSFRYSESIEVLPCCCSGGKVHTGEYIGKLEDKTAFLSCGYVSGEQENWQLSGYM